MRSATLLLLLAACAEHATPRAVVSVPPATSAEGPAPKLDVDAAMAHGWSLIAAGRGDEGLAALRAVAAAAAPSVLPRRPMCGQDDPDLQLSADGRIFWLMTPRGFFFFTTQPSPIGHAAVGGVGSTVLAGPRLLLSEVQDGATAPAVRALDLSGSARFEVAAASVVVASEAGSLVVLERWAEPHTFEAWDAAGGRLVHELSLAQGDEIAIGKPQVAPDERSVVLPLHRATRDHAYALFDVATGVERGAWPYDLGSLGPAFAHDGRMLAVADAHTSDTQVVEAATGKTVARSRACPHPLGAGFTRSGRMLAVSSHTGACAFELPAMRLRWRAALQSEKEWESVDYHDDLSIAGFVGDESAAVVTAAQGSRVVVVDLASGRKLFDGCGNFFPETGAILSCQDAGGSAVVTFDRLGALHRRALSEAERAGAVPELGLAPEQAMCALADAAACRLGDWIVPASACPR
jgi:hypothetical protein